MLDPAMDAPMEEPPAEEAPAEDHISALKQGFRAACMHVLDGEGDVKSKMSKLKEILTASDKLLSSGEPVEEADDEEVKEGEDEELEECDEDDMKESLKRKVRRLEAREEVRELCESKNYSPSRAMLNALVAVPKADREALIDEARGGTSARRPRNQPIAEGRGGQDGTTRDIKDGKSFAERLKGGMFSGN
jgi:methylase of polypeptide subunit release factors